VSLQYHPQASNYPHKTFTKNQSVDKLLITYGLPTAKVFISWLISAKYAETDIPAEEEEVQQGPWIPQADAHEVRSQRPEAPHAEGTQARLDQAARFRQGQEALTHASKHLLPAIHRLKQEKDFSQLARSRKIAFSKALGLKMRENGLPHSRFGVVVGLKVHKKAVKRNLIKRRIREIVRKHLKEIAPGHDVMIMVNAKALDAEYAELEAQVLSCLTKLRILKA
jgi:ribonuclease P protein component